MNYYEEIKRELVDNELTKKVKDYSKNKSDLMHYYNVGKLIIDAQGGEERAKYGNGLIKEYSLRLKNDLGQGYETTSLKRMRQFYLIVQKGAPLVHQLTWSHYIQLIVFDNINKITYYINECVNRNLSKRELQYIIKSHEYERLDNKTKNKLISKDSFEITDFIKNTIVIRSSISKEIISEKYLKKLILEDLDNFLKELGDGFTYIGNEYKINIGDTFNYIDFLLFNYKYNSFVVVELKVTELKKDHIGQIEVYMNYIDKNIKEINHDKTIGLIICKHDNKLILEYSSDPRIFSTTYKVIERNL